jgi:MoaA/NifB/PqqE/SkfB family radical SAM enzyme
MNIRLDKRSLQLVGEKSSAHRQTGGPATPIWYLSNLQRCNFTCSYCASGQPALQRNKVLPTWAGSSEVHERIVDWLVAQPLTIALRMNTIGEPFVSASYLESVGRLSHSHNISFVEILTNGSFRPNQFEQFADKCAIEKVSLWMTFHHEFIAPAEFVGAAMHARAMGAFVVVNTLLFPDNAEAVREVIDSCERQGIRVVRNGGINFNEAYPSQGYAPRGDDPLVVNPHGELYSLSEAPEGRPCRAGFGYFFIDPRGKVFPCFTYSLQGRRPMGSVLDREFRLTPQPGVYGACESPKRCRCPEDYQNLEAIQNRFSWPFPTFGLPTELDVGSAARS